MNREGVTISYERLLEVFEHLLTYVRETRPGDALTVEENLFWSIPVDEMTDVYSDPPLTIGKVSETWENIEKFLAEDLPAPFVLTWFADILRAAAKDLMD
ncbi:hypothetical protein [Nocardia higoensis]|uniref:hypothetical protein n=1 Tax=Nocardia higoensis TaxID=228599 RepID=UPI000301E99D|nr:hypothetical protein [Nocardia higoensis]